ncbi:NUDIX domain-containing protein [Halovenus sp. WSH3]|uniref:NUDIX domain-containing protein n=1 Tax=Halovenus carboxidivorans TaxID=2692199 RepID=A0A6B0TBY2_9EURY|nr:CoA pyrophosphatase [Halovenus carboxidivorans]MXR52410.1 NUDIX domain-containing protein [Halovenus carboxidivorans]
MDLAAVRAFEPATVDDQERKAAVIVPVIDRESGPHVLFTKRAEHLSDHPGQMSFPGGGHEPEDESLEVTAKREGNEEIGLDPSEVSIVGRLDDIRTITRYSVRPFVAEVPDRVYEPHDGEVAEVAILPVAELTDLENYQSERREHPYYGDIRLHYFYVDGYTVWGATARMLVQFLELATDWTVPPEPDREVGPDADYPV